MALFHYKWELALVRLATVSNTSWKQLITLCFTHTNTNMTCSQILDSTLCKTELMRHKQARRADKQNTLQISQLFMYRAAILDCKDRVGEVCLTLQVRNLTSGGNSVEIADGELGLIPICHYPWHYWDFNWVTLTGLKASFQQAGVC